MSSYCVIIISRVTRMLSGLSWLTLETETSQNPKKIHATSVTYSLVKQRKTKISSTNSPLFSKNPTSPTLSCRRRRQLLAGGCVKQYESRCFSQWRQGQLLCHDEMHSIWSRGSQFLSLCLSVWWFCRLLLCSYSGNFQIVALANLIPADDATDELDSYMYQTVGFFLIFFSPLNAERTYGDTFVSRSGASLWLWVRPKLVTLVQTLNLY